MRKNRIADADQVTIRERNPLSSRTRDISGALPPPRISPL